MPEQEVRLGDVAETGARVASFPTRSGPDDVETETENRRTADEESEADGDEEDDWNEPPVEEGEVRTVEIEGTGDQVMGSPELSAGSL